MDDATGLAEALLGLDGFRVLGVEETPSEVIVTVETTADCRRVPELRCAGRGQGSSPGRHPGPALLRAPGPAGLAEAPVALCRSRLRGQDLDRGHRARRPSGRAHRSGRSRGHPPGGRAGPAGRRRRPRARGVLVDGDGRRRPPRHAAGRGPQAGRRRSGPSASTRPRSSRPTREHRTIYVTGLVDLRPQEDHRHGGGQRRP